MSANGHGKPSAQPLGSHYNYFLDVRAFIASPCGPGETAELYFSLFNRAENRFLTEEFCLILNHLGSPARDGEQRIGRLRTLFTDLKQEDLAGSIFLVCRLVRNGALKMRSNSSAGTLDVHQRSINGRHPPAPVTDTGTLRSAPSLYDNVTDDSFSVTSGFAGHRTMTADTSVTTMTGSIVDGRPSYRRPLGCAVLELPHLSKLLSDGADLSGTGLEFTMPIYTPKEESMFATLHEDIIHNRTKDVYTTSR